MTVARVSQESARVVSNGTPNARVSQISARVVAANTVRAQIAQLVPRVVSTNVPNDSTTKKPVVFVIT